MSNPAHRWVREGTELFQRELATLSDEELSAPSLLPGWTRTHLAGHVGLNADALRNLATWARTGVETPMYSSPQQRADDISQAGSWPAGQVRDFASTTAQRLADDLDALTPEQWQAPIRTAQGREVPAEEMLWMRAREVLVHAVDLGTGLSFNDLPDDFNVALLQEITAKRSSEQQRLTAEPSGDDWMLNVTAPDPLTVHGSAADLAAWLAGRSQGTDLQTTGGVLPTLGPWL